MYGVLNLWPGGVGLSLCSGKTVLGWGGTLGQGAEPPTALRVGFQVSALDVSGPFPL